MSFTVDQILQFCCISPQFSWLCHSVECCHIQVGMKRLPQLPLTSTHNETKGQERRGSFWKPLQNMEEGLFQLLSLLSLSLFSKGILLKQGFKSNHTSAQNPLVYPISLYIKARVLLRPVEPNRLWPSITSLLSSPTLVPFVNSALATRASLLFPKHTKPIPTSGHFAWSVLCKLH